jgi:hypothetical protein
VIFLLTLGGRAPGLAPAQEAKPAAPPAATEGLSVRYRFQERYALAEDAAKPGLLNQYYVGTRETIKITTDKPKGAPDVQQSMLQTVYTERAAKLSGDGSVGEVIRRFDRFNFKSTLDIPTTKTKWLEGLTVLYRPPQNRLEPRTLSLTPERQIRQREYDAITVQTFVPALRSIFPPVARRQGDRWEVSLQGARALTGEIPISDGFDLTAELLTVRKNESGTGMTAEISVKGQFEVMEGSAAINAEVRFLFEPSPIATRSGGERLGGDPANKSSAPGRVESQYDANGFISGLRMAYEKVMPQPRSDGRIKRSVRRELVLARQTTPPQGVSPGLLEIPNPMPEPTMQNSWLTYDDPQRRFHFRYPQELRLKPPAPDEPVELYHRFSERDSDSIVIGLVPKGKDPQQDRLAADPEHERKLLTDQWDKEKQEYVMNPSGWLPEAEWTTPTLRRRVNRFEAALKRADDVGPGAQGGRVYYDQYIVQFSRNEVLKVVAMTTQDPHLKFRAAAEQVIRSFEFGPSEGTSPGPPIPSPGPAR